MSFPTNMLSGSRHCIATKQNKNQTEFNLWERTASLSEQKG